MKCIWVLLAVRLFSKSSSWQEVPSVEETAVYRFNTLHLTIWHAIWSPALYTRSFHPTAFTKQTFILLYMCASVEILWSAAVIWLPLFPKSVVKLKNAGICAGYRNPSSALYLSSTAMHCSPALVSMNAIDTSSRLIWIGIMIVPHMICGSVPGACIFSKPHSGFFQQL